MGAFGSVPAHELGKTAIIAAMADAGVSADEIDEVILGQVLTGMTADAEPVEGKKNDPMMPVAWTKTYRIDGGPSGRVFTTTMGSSTDMVAEGTRRMLVNAVYWATGLEDTIPTKSCVDVVGTFEPTPFGFDAARKGLKPGDL